MCRRRVRQGPDGEHDRLVRNRVDQVAAALEDPSQVEPATAEYVDWYNHRRLRGETGHVPPVEYENDHYLAATESQVTPNV
ncbi:IS3 family transposase [Streptomyces somaliensis]|uniref:IS3 family transposase n=1 Tax=Streptomyces somaliensis TaxID=78355 RepID=UPI0035562359